MASGLEGGPAAKRARVAESETIARHKRFFKLREENVTGFGPCAQGLRGNFYVHVAGETQPRLVHGDVEAKLELREFMLEPRHEHASYNARDSGKHEVRSVGVCGQRDDSVMKILGKTFAWTREENVGRVANDDADVIVCASKDDALDLCTRRKKHFCVDERGECRSQILTIASCASLVAVQLYELYSRWLPGKGYGYNLPSRRCATGRRRRFAL